MRLLKIIILLLVITILTILTQIGGLVFLFSLLTWNLIDKHFTYRLTRTAMRVLSFTVLYLACIVILVPPLAQSLGRVPLPLFKQRNVQPGTIWTCVLNRNYVRPELREVVFEVADRVVQEFPGTVVNYLDANFPFIDKFPLPPHLSHSDGKKLDVSFIYRNKKSGDISTEMPSYIGSGICEAPQPGEENMPEICNQKGYWQYNFISGLVSQAKSELEFDASPTKRLVNLFAAQEGVGKIFIEPHLKTRLQLISKKIRFHGCQAVRHDDHIHVQLR